MTPIATSSNEAASVRSALADQQQYTAPRSSSSSTLSTSRKRRVATASSSSSQLSDNAPAAAATLRLSRLSSSSHLALHPHRRLLRESTSSSSILAASASTIALSSRVFDALLSSKAGLRRVFHTYDPFPTSRYVFVREWEVHASNSTSTNSRGRSGSGLRHQVLHSVVALDRVDGKHVELTCLAKAIVTEWYAACLPCMAVP